MVVITYKTKVGSGRTHPDLAFFAMLFILLNAYCCSASVIVKSNSSFRCSGRLDECLFEEELELELLMNPYASRMLGIHYPRPKTDVPGEPAIACGKPGDAYNCSLDPDYARCRQLTEKSDVCSFGVVLFEVLCARKALNPKLEQEEQWNLANWARKCIENETIGEIIDPNLMGKIAPECFKVYVDVARNCVHDQGIQRPTMNDVMEKLSFALQLQKQAEAKKEKVNLDGEDMSYTKVLSFQVSDTTVARQYNDVFSGPVLESDSRTWLTTDNTGMTYPSLETDTVRCEDLFTDTSNSKA